jgi:hypothetical protein
MMGPVMIFVNAGSTCRVATWLVLEPEVSLATTQ